MSIQLLQRAISYMEEHICETMDYADAAKYVSMSSYNFHRMFSFVAGMTASEYVRKRRLTLAALELQETDISVIDVVRHRGRQDKKARNSVCSIRLQ